MGDTTKGLWWKRGRRDEKSPRDTQFAVTVSTRDVRAATPIKPHSCGCLNKALARMTSIDVLRDRKAHKASTPDRNDRQLRNAESEGTVFPR